MDSNTTISLITYLAPIVIAGCVTYLFSQLGKSKSKSEKQEERLNTYEKELHLLEGRFNALKENQSLQFEQMHATIKEVKAALEKIFDKLESK